MFELYQSEKNQKYYFRLKAKNGQIILTSQGYATKSGAKNGIESVRRNSADDSRFERKVASNGKYHFNLIAKNNHVVGTSRIYPSHEVMEKTILEVKKVGLNIINGSQHTIKSKSITQKTNVDNSQSETKEELILNHFKKYDEVFRKLAK